MYPMRSLLPLAAFLALALPAAADAGTAEVTGSVIPPSCNTKCLDGSDTTTIRFTASPGEANDLVVTRAVSGSNDVVTFRDAAGPVVVTQQAVGGRGCVAQSDGSAVCTAASGRQPFIALGDGDDRASATPGGAAASGFSRGLTIDGAAGNDVITGTSHLDVLDGGSGDDTLDGLDGDDSITDLSGKNTIRGGLGVDSINAGGDADDVDAGDGKDFVRGGGGAGDVLRGGAGDDEIDDGDKTGAADADAVDGGPGVDRLDLTKRSAPLRVDLTAGTGGEAGEGDTLAGLEIVLGGTKNDRLTGDGSANLLNGGAGRDTLDGRAGDDTLVANFDIATCGAGVDLVIAPNKKQVLGRDCELVDPWDNEAPVARPRLKGSSLTFTVPCPTIDPEIDSCLASVKVGPRGTWGSGVARKAVRAGRSATVTVRLSPAGLRASKARKALIVRIHHVFNDPDEGFEDDTLYTLAL
jgi:Ca2+-binding RTX toxin-like protein